MIWTRSGKNVLRCQAGDTLWRIVKFPWGAYILWKGEDYMGKHATPDEAKKMAEELMLDSA